MRGGDPFVFWLQMGLDPELFVGPVSEHLLCPICQDVLVSAGVIDAKYIWDVMS